MSNIVQKPGREVGWGLFNNNLDDVLEGFFRPYAVKPGDVAGGGLVPAIDLHENDNSYTVRAEIPGVKKEDVDVTVHDGVLTINAESRYENEEKEDGRVIRQERRYGKYVRSIRLGKDVDENQVKASYKDGILELVLPKVEEVKPKKISIDVN
ncbi:MAG: Hsp20/alpha crystallin family protein [Pseudomonadota bacterium]|nr:Hsp20/alpha crystallin family protein [Pseudomonadota bacterium]